MGVRPGWKIHTIDGYQVHDGNEVWMRLQEAKWQWRSTYVSFVTDTAVIRAERARARAAAIKAEEERVAKLPFEGVHDAAHMAQLLEAFAFQGYIERPEDRGITLEQLQHVVRWSKDRCHRWRDTASADESRTSGMKLNLDIMNMYHLHHWLIKPATADKFCSLVEMLSSQKQPPSWCVIHWWGERIADFQRCLECQLTTRGLPFTTAFWVAAFAIRPHSTLDDNSDPTKSRFYRAMTVTQSHVLLVTNSKREHMAPAMALTRLWCCYELTMCAEQPRLTLDIATCSGSKAVLLMNGFTDEEEVTEDRGLGTGYKAKTDREKVFPLDIAERALGLRLELAQTSVYRDRGRLLNIIAGRDVGLQPVEEHELYNKANRRLRALFALAFWRRIMAAGASDSLTQPLQARMADTLRNDIWRTSMSVCMAFCVSTAPEEKLALLMKSLPPNLRQLKVDLKGLDIVNDSLPVLAASLPRELEDLSIDLSHNVQLDNFGLTAFVNSLPPKQRGVCLGLACTAVSPEFQEKRDSLDGLKTQIIYEAQKGSVCVTLNLCPSPDRRMHVSSSRTKV
mmetsp:Transcript_120312/g.365909  ORF Transcript_120312/g.365909 Transcript_120312/m.365909 type:complete len:566 (-) Transcript_120312:174-1871(-)